MKCRRKLFIILLFIIVAIIISLPCAVYADEGEELSQSIKELLSSLDLQQLQTYLDEFGEGYFDLSGSAESILTRLINGDLNINYSNYLNSVLSILFEDVTAFLPQFTQIIGLTILSAIITAAEGAIMSRATAKAVRCVCYCVISMILISMLINIISVANDAINNVKCQIEIIMPLLILVTVLCGGNNVGAVYQPSAVFLSGGAVELISGFIFPVTICVVIFNLLSSINDKISFYGTCSAIKSLLKWTIGITVTIFSVFMTVQSQAAGLFDGIFFKATKYLVGNSVPIVGNFLSSGVDILVASASAVRSALGLLGLVILIAQVIKPITLFAAFSLMLKLLSAIAQPIGESGLTTLFDNMSKDVEFFIAGILMVAFMYALIIMLVINCANYLI